MIYSWQWWYLYLRSSNIVFRVGSVHRTSQSVACVYTDEIESKTEEVDGVVKRL